MQKFLKSALLLGVSSAACFASVAQAAVTISTGATTGVACVSGVCTASAATAVLNVTDLTNLLAGGSVKVVPGKKALDIVVAAPLSWVSTNRLTFSAYRSIIIQQPTTLTGTGALTLATNVGKTGGTLSFKGKGNVNFWDVHSSLIINGNSYKLVNDIATLATAVAAKTSGHFALAKSYDAKLDGTYKAAPIPLLDGAFEGLGNSISNLKITLKTPTALDPYWMGEAGLFGVVSATGSIENIAMLNAHVSAGDLMNAGLLVGELDGTVANSHSSGTSTVGKGILEGSNPHSADAGGLIGVMVAATALVSNSYSTATVTAGDSSVAGGLIGSVFLGGTITDSYASGDVTTGNNIFGRDQSSLAGGLIGLIYNVSGSTTVNRDHASGIITGGTNESGAGGLLGAVGGLATIENSYATGPVSVGTGAVATNPGVAGGLIGSDLVVSTASEVVTQCYATGAISGAPTTLIGGFIGYTLGTISNSYATGSVTLSGGGTLTAAGGFVGLSDENAYISVSYSTGLVHPMTGASVGGFQGSDIGSNGYEDYWDITTSGFGASQGAGNTPNDPGLAGLTSTQLQSGLPTGFSSTIWKESGAINSGFPYLAAIPPQ